MLEIEVQRHVGKSASRVQLAPGADDDIWSSPFPVYYVVKEVNASCSFPGARLGANSSGLRAQARLNKMAVA